ncbi:MAG: YitT family protein [Oscillospiraceae bacterium]|nr:YitT family protein [Oscillospiraceae bacterium]
MSIVLSRKKIAYCAAALLGSGILAFGIYEIHAISAVTEGGVLGLTLLLDHWFGISPAVSGLVLNLLCYGFGWRMLGKRFLFYSAVSAGGFSLVYGLLERTEPLWPQFSHMPLAAALLGAVFVGVGVGLCVRAGGAPTGDDALAMSLSRLLKTKIQYVYLVSDLAVLLLSLSYIPWQRIGYSLLTVILSGQIIGWLQKEKADKE